MNIRVMTAQDKNVCLPMVKEFYCSDAVDHPVPLEILERTFLDAVGENPHLCGLVFEDGEQVVGFAYLTFFYACEVGGEVVMIEEVFIKEQCRGRGFGQEFLDYLHTAYPKAARFRLEVTKENTGAVRLYERNGFKQISYMQMIKDFV